ncbi:hypothetical protein ACF0H5_006582 [Mactra antiquata]
MIAFNDDEDNGYSTILVLVKPITNTTTTDSTQINNIKSQLNTVDIRGRTNSRKISTNGDKLTTANRDIQQIKRQLNLQLQQNQLTKNTIIEKLQRKQTETEDFQKQINDMTKTLDDLKANTDEDTKNKIRTLQTNFNRLSTRVNTLQTNLSTARGNFQKYQKIVDGIGETIDNLSQPDNIWTDLASWLSIGSSMFSIITNISKLIDEKQSEFTNALKAAKDASELVRNIADTVRNVTDSIQTITHTIDVLKRTIQNNTTKTENNKKN